MSKGKVVSLTPRRTITSKTTSSGFSFTAEVEKDVEKLMEKLNLDRDAAISLATDFYRSYPMLMEHVRTPNHLLGGGK